jgi:hypothetical protein
MTELTSAAEADLALKRKHRAMWASGDYPMVATELIPQLGPILGIWPTFRDRLGPACHAVR